MKLWLVWDVWRTDDKVLQAICETEKDAVEYLRNDRYAEMEEWETIPPKDKEE